MRQIFFLLVFFHLIIYVYPQETNPNGLFIIMGKLMEKNNSKIMLDYINKYDKLIHDTAIIKRGAFKITGFIKEPTIAYLYYSDTEKSNDESNSKSLFLEATNINVSIDKNNFRINNSHTQNEFNLLNAEEFIVLSKKQPLEQQYSNIIDSLDKDPNNKMLKDKAHKILILLAPFNKQIQKIEIYFIATHPNSFVSSYLMEYYVSRLSIDSAKMLYSNFNKVVQNSRSGKYVNKKLYGAEAGSVGHIATNFSTKDIEGKAINLSSFKGKSFVLLDFWATWCVPCRKSNPHLISIYNKYHSKGLDIIGIANDDANKDAWEKAVKKDSVEMWYNILQGFDREKFYKGESNENDIGEKFGINGFPTKILINKEGLIIGRYEEEDDTQLDQKLSEIFR